MKLSKVFRKAKSKLDRHGLQGICYVLEELNDVPSQDKYRALDLISDRLGNFAWASDWLAHQILFPKRYYCNLSLDDRRRMVLWRHAQGPKAIQAWRLRWLDQLIAEFEAQGD
jgi:hypothetical protein